MDIRIMVIEGDSKNSVKLFRRRSIRLAGHDYSSDGVYFVTVCAQDQRRFFGHVSGGVMVMNEAGKMVERWWKKVFEKFPGVVMDQYCVMPNHVWMLMLVEI